MKDPTRQQIMMLHVLNNGDELELSTEEIRGIPEKQFAYTPSLPGFLMGMERLRSRKWVSRRKDGQIYFAITDAGIKVLDENLKFYFGLYLTK
jgi:hypothetical protein